MVEPKSAKNCPTASLPWRTPYHGAAFPAASAAQSTSSVTASRMAATSPRPKASYTFMMVLVLASALMMKTPPRQRVICHPGYVAGPAPGSPGGPRRPAESAAGRSGAAHQHRADVELSEPEELPHDVNHALQP